MHDLVQKVAFLLGTWKGAGKGSFPGISPFAYDETIEFTECGKPFLAYKSTTQKAGTTMPMHSETGYLRCLPDGSLQLCAVQSTGVLEIETGTVTASNQLAFISAHLANTTKITALRRQYDVNGQTLNYSVYMSTNEQAKSGVQVDVLHLQATLTKQ